MAGNLLRPTVRFLMQGGRLYYGQRVGRPAGAAYAQAGVNRRKAKALGSH